MPAKSIEQVHNDADLSGVRHRDPLLANKTRAILGFVHNKIDLVHYSQVHRQ